MGPWQVVELKGERSLFIGVIRRSSFEKESNVRDGRGTESVAVGSESFVRATKEKLGFKAKGRKVIGGDGRYVLRESPAPYKGNLEHENAVLRAHNEYLWGDIG